MKPLYLSKAKINVKSLAAEARAIRKEEKERTEPEEIEELRYHRAVRLRAEARATLLAYAYLRGRSYCTVETLTTTKDLPVSRMLEKMQAWRVPGRLYAGAYPLDSVHNWLNGLPTPIDQVLKELKERRESQERREASKEGLGTA